MRKSTAAILRFGTFELDTEAEQLTKNGRIVRLQPQPYKLLRLLTTEAGRVVTREELRAVLWPDETYVDFDQGINFAVKQVREALDDDADRPVYLQTVPKRGYRFVAPVSFGDEAGDLLAVPSGEMRLHKALWANILELRLADEARKRRRRQVLIACVVIGCVVAAALIIRAFQ